MPLRLGDVLRLRKPHPCGENRWEVLRVGADFRLRCLGCGHLVMMPRSELERRIREVIPADAAQARPVDPPRPPARGGPPPARR